MKRREFIKKSAFSAFAVSTFGFVRFNGKNYIGDCATTSDILGPFYRPDSPVRNNLIIAGESGKAVELSGTVRHQDCITPYKNAKVELWHCDNNGIYDNSSDDFRYRGTTFTNDHGEYSFTTVLPVPYDVGNGMIRPAHFHMMITTEDYQPLVTQLYFTGDKYIESDTWAANATGRVLDIEELSDGTARVYFPVNMAKTLSAEPASIDKLIGEYIHETNPGSSMVFFKNENKLWVKNEVFGTRYEYKGNNTFTYPGTPEGHYRNLYFELLPSGSVKCTLTFTDAETNEQQQIFIKSS
ncbi:catechol 1,2-dioxygenase [Rhodohalobacter mucosus]|uniref:Catechol 1,2-dioxygenase n=1 Tax=Rhodohalobacter mucosus TaxID=2079485 RepID=A0A316TR50_9BACT|nr:catechol 1,2-dioxygenase [Rhodohalobacter mucosus]PWN05505.1 catechol 1,2-dioxygenase [Rhodohalobacter mucosus]